MNNIVKIILGLNIAAGGAGIFFGITKTGRVGTMKQAKMDAEGKAATAMKDKRDAEGKFTAEAKEVTKLKGENANLTFENDRLTKAGNGAQIQIDQANTSAQIAQAAAAKANSDLIEAQQVANQVPGLQGQIAAYENLGTPQDIKERLNRLAKLEEDKGHGPDPDPPEDPESGEVGTIQNHDPQLDFYVINVGSDNGVNKGDKYTIFRSGKAIGKIEISRSQPTVSIAVYQKGFPKPTAPFKSGDKVMKIN